MPGGARGSVRVPGPGHVRGTRRARAPRASPRPRRRRPGPRRPSWARRSSWSRPRSRPVAGARPAASRSPAARTRRPSGPARSSGWTSRATWSSTVMIAEGADIAEEYYFSLLLDRANRRYLAMCSKEGGMDIETLAVERPEALARIAGRPATVGIDQAKADEIVAAAGFAGDDAARDRPGAAAALARCTAAEDATLVEVNPLVKTGDGEIVALDGKVSLDENADFRHARARGAGRQVGRGPAGGGGQGQGPELRQARRVGRDHRQRGGPGDEHPGRGRVRGGGVRRARPSRPTSSTSAAGPAPR